MRTLVLASQKGGSGKTTLSGHLAVEAERSGAGPVVLIDTDPQGSLSHWWNARKSETPTFVKVGSMELKEVLFQLSDAGVKLAIVDTPPAIIGAISNVVACADLVIVPTRPSPHDLRAVGATVDIVEEFRKPLIFVVNDATQRARITGETAVALSQHGTVAPTTIHHRIDFAASMVDGRTVGEVDERSKSSQEVRALWTYIADRLQRLPDQLSLRKTVQAPFRVSPASLVPDDEDHDEALIELPPKTNLGTTGIQTSRKQHSIEPDDAPNTYEADRRSGEADRRSGADHHPSKPNRRTFSGVERRLSHPFGRRKNDRVL